MDAAPRRGKREVKRVERISNVVSRYCKITINTETRTLNGKNYSNEQNC